MSKPQINSPLNDDHYQQIQNGLDILTALQPELDRAKRAGIDVSVQQADADAAKAKLLALKNNYFPNR